MLNATTLTTPKHFDWASHHMSTPPKNMHNLKINIINFEVVVLPCPLIWANLQNLLYFTKEEVTTP